jgi:hypothetical protein
MNAKLFGTGWMAMLAAASLATLGGVAGCATDASTGDEEDLTSIRARSRELKFEGIVYVSPDASDDEILATVHRQTRTAFGPLRTSGIGVNNRELVGVDPGTFKKRPVTVVDTTKAKDAGKAMIEVRYTYVDDAVVPVSMANRSSLATAVLRPDYTGQTDRIIKECTANDSEAHEFASDLWYVLEPSVSSCKTAMKTEQDAITAARAKLAHPDTQVAALEANRLYVPVTMSLGADKTNTGKSYPEYDRLYSGGVQKGKLVISLLNGVIDHGGGDLYEDSGYGEWLDSIDQILEARPGFKVTDVEGGVDISSYTLASGKQVTGVGFGDFISYHNGSGFPSGLSYADQQDLEKQVAERVADKWITFELPAKVKIGTAKAKNLTIQFKTFFGHADTTTPYKTAIKNSDVFLYNGHSMIGYGPLDPDNFTAADFPSSYQILFIDSCVSYNYYEADYIPLKKGGTKNLDLITNGVEAPSYQSGYALGRFISKLVDGSNASYLDLLESAEATGSGMRVVDGELDTVWSPSKKKITLTVQ